MTTHNKFQFRQERVASLYANYMKTAPHPTPSIREMTCYTPKDLNGTQSECTDPTHMSLHLLVTKQSLRCDPSLFLSKV